MTTPSTVTVDPGAALVTDLGTVDTSGPTGVVWGMNSPQLNANLVSLQAGDSMQAHRNDEVDVLIVVEAGSGTLTIDGSAHAIGTSSVALVPRGTTRSLTADAAMLYYSIHQRRDGVSLRQ